MLFRMIDNDSLRMMNAFVAIIWHSKEKVTRGITWNPCRVVLPDQERDLFHKAGAI